MASEEHLKILQQGVAVWNEWRKKNPELHPDLGKAVLYRGSAHETDSIPLTEYCRAFLGQRRGARRLEIILRVVAAAVS
jgi:hypothetical protein